MLEADGISAEVINIHTIKPLDEELVLSSAKKTGKVVTVEEHSVIGGLGSAVADVLSEKRADKNDENRNQRCIRRIRSGSSADQKYGLDAESIYKK